MPLLLPTWAFLSLTILAGAAPKDFTGQDLRNHDFTGDALDGAHFDDAKLTFANFTHATLKNASFRGADLQGARFNKATLDGADFTGAKLRGAIFTDAKAWHTIFTGTEIHLARAALLDLAALREKGFTLDQIDAIRSAGSSDATSGSLSFHYADLRGCLLLGNAEDVDFRGADLQEADFRNVENLAQARLKGAKYNTATQWKIDPAQAGAILVAGGPAPEAPGSAQNPFMGKWFIIKENGGAKDNGTLTFTPDHQFEWVPSLAAATPEILTGKWSGDNKELTIKNGESGQNWSASLTLRKGKPELHLKGADGAQRLGVQE